MDHRAWPSFVAIGLSENCSSATSSESHLRVVHAAPAKVLRAFVVHRYIVDSCPSCVSAGMPVLTDAAACHTSQHPMVRCRMCHVLIPSSPPDAVSMHRPVGLGCAQKNMEAIRDLEPTPTAVVYVRQGVRAPGNCTPSRGAPPL
eukprot:6199533-Pleurochrysis_carterae.AAC.1